MRDEKFLNDKTRFICSFIFLAYLINYEPGTTMPDEVDCQLLTLTDTSTLSLMMGLPASGLSGS